jgi:ribonuclease-3
MVLSADVLLSLQERLGVRFENPDLLVRSLAHRSWCAENGDLESNERLEFLGDSVLGLVVTRYVFEHFPHLPEGQLSEVRAGVVNARALAEVAAELGLGEFLLLGKGELAAGGRSKPSILSDAMEAVIAVVYLDRGWDVAHEFVLRLLGSRIGVAAAGPGGRDYKTRLQELAAQLSIGRPRYDVSDDGPDHAKRFYATVSFSGVSYGSGEGRSKKEAEQEAAWRAWLELTGESAHASTPIAPAIRTPERASFNASPASQDGAADRAAGPDDVATPDHAVAPDPRVVSEEGFDAGAA